MMMSLAMPHCEMEMLMCHCKSTLVSQLSETGLAPDLQNPSKHIETQPIATPPNTQRNKHVIITSKRSVDVIITCLCVLCLQGLCPECGSFEDMLSADTTARPWDIWGGATCDIGYWKTVYRPGAPTCTQVTGRPCLRTVGSGCHHIRFPSFRRDTLPHDRYGLIPPGGILAKRA